MAKRRDTGSDISRPARLALMLLVASTFLLADLIPGAGPSVAVAQERSRTIIDMLFGGPPPRRYIDEPPPRRILRKTAATQRKKPVATASRRQGGAAKRASPAAAANVAAAAGAAAAPVVVEKSATAKTVLVVGDFMAGSLAGGLTEAVERNTGVRVVAAANGSSGLVRDDHYDWLDQIGPLIDEKKPAVVVAMLGSNDRQAIQMKVEGGSLPTRSEAWIAEYERRVDAFAKTVKDRNLPLVWVGMPSFKFDRMSEDMAYLNEIYRKAATTTGGGEFVDIWEGFVDANGAFAYSGPDIAGQPARLRNTDGITMTPAGAEKLAFFAEKPILRLLGTTADGDSPAVLGPEEMSSLKLPPIANAANATSAPLVALSDPALDGGEALLGGDAAAGVPLVDPSPRDKLVVSGTLAPGPAGRADDFNWSAKTTAVVPLKPVDAVVFRGSVDLSKVRQPAPRQPPDPMPSLADAILDDWSAPQRAESIPAPAAQRAPAGTPPARPEPPASATARPVAAAPVSASPFAEDQSPR